MAKLTLDGITYPSADAAKAFLLGKMTGYVTGAPIPAADVPLWFEVLQKHEWFDEYVTHGISHFSVQPSEQRPDLRNMVVVNSAGESKPFTHHKYLTRGALPKLAKVLAALRTEVEPQIAPLRRKGRHVHHAGKPFLQIADEFLIAHAHRWHTIDTEAAGATGYRLSDRTLATAWCAHHQGQATLVSLTAAQNMQAGAGGYKMAFTPPGVPAPPY